MSSLRGSSSHNTTKVAFLGPPASYSHQAALKEFPPQGAYELEPKVTIKDVFEAVQNQETVHGVVPFENSTHGSVVQTLDLFSDRAGQLPDIYVSGEIYVDIEHCLLGLDNGSTNARAPSPGYATPTVEIPAPKLPHSHPLTDVSHIKHIYSHPQAFGQSFTFINSYLRGAELHEVSSTSKGAEIVSRSNDPSMAAICSEAAADIFKLKVLARSIQDLGDNTTRFFVIRRGPGGVPKNGTSHHPGSKDQAGDPKAWKSLVGFGIDHKQAGALADALNVFKIHGLNLTSINSRPSHRRHWHYMFLVEFEGKVEGLETGHGDMALKDLQEYTEELRWYGSWENKNKGPVSGQR